MSQKYPVCFIVSLRFHFLRTEKFGSDQGLFLQRDPKFGSKERGSVNLSLLMRDSSEKKRNSGGF